MRQNRAAIPLQDALTDGKQVKVKWTRFVGLAAPATKGTLNRLQARENRCGLKTGLNQHHRIDVGRPQSTWQRA